MTYIYGYLIQKVNLHQEILYLVLLGWLKGGPGKNVKILGVDNSSSAHADNRKKDILILGKGSTDG